MNEIVKEIKYTGIVSLSLLIIIFIVGVGYPSLSYSITKEKLTEVKDQEVIDAVTKKIDHLDNFRKANINTDTISNYEMLSFIFQNLNEKDYSIKKISPLKIVCQLTDGISFTSSETCNVLIINNKKIDNYKNLLFKYDKELELVDFEFNGLDCKTNGSYYYCLMTDYKYDNDRDFNYIEGVYKVDDMIVVYEYYLSFKFDHANCMKYYGADVCFDGYEGEYPEIDDEVIKENGVYYRHEFVYEDDELYLLQSFIFNE